MSFKASRASRLLRTKSKSIREGFNLQTLRCPFALSYSAGHVDRNIIVTPPSCAVWFYRPPDLALSILPPSSSNSLPSMPLCHDMSYCKLTLLPKCPTVLLDDSLNNSTLTHAMHSRAIIKYKGVGFSSPPMRQKGGTAFGNGSNKL